MCHYVVWYSHLAQADINDTHVDDRIPVLSTSMFEEAFRSLDRSKGATPRIDQGLE